VLTEGSTFQPDGGDPRLIEELDLSCVDGFVVARTWSQVQPTMEGGYDWGSLNADLDTLASRGKKAVVEIEPGTVGSPSWLCQSVDAGGAGATCITLVQILNPTGERICESVQLPVPWDAVYKEKFGQMARDFAAHFAGYSAVVEIHVSGINDTHNETALPTSEGGTVPCTDGGACHVGLCEETDSVAALVDAGYGYVNMKLAFNELASDFHDGAPKMTLGSQVSASLPSPGSTNMARQLVDGFIHGCFGPITVQDDALEATNPPDPGTSDAQAGVPSRTLSMAEHRSSSSTRPTFKTTKPPA
jgi:hypothetical protein